MIKVEESYSDDRYEIYFQVDESERRKDDPLGLMYWDKGTSDLDETIRICDELDRKYSQWLKSKGEDTETSGHYVVCSIKGNGYNENDVVIEYVAGSGNKTMTESKTSRKKILAFDDDFDSSWTVFEIDPSKVDAEKFAVCALGMDADDDEYQNHNYADIIDDYDIRIVSASDYDDFDYDVDKIVKFFDVDEVYYGKDLYKKYKEFN